jgi:glyoxylase-like metal-dependent hydrolase (beta-lactamase superfamily II)/ferredoxin
MADLNRKLEENAPGELFVDDSCIDCDTCRELAPVTFGSLRNGQSFVREQPRDGAEWRRALQAVVSCPTASIGAERSAKEAARDLPVAIADQVFRCGYSSEDSYGAQSYFLRRPDGNVLVDSPRAAAPLLKRLEDLGGVQKMFLTHRDDVADHAAFHARFGCQRIIQRADDQIGAELLLGDEPREIGAGLLAIPVPGHTRGSCALLVDERWLFTGDHLWAEEPALPARGGARTRGASNDDEGHLQMGRGVCWYSWPEQLRSLRKLLDYSFEHVLPGHGRSLELSKAAMREQVGGLVRRLT